MSLKLKKPMKTYFLGSLILVAIVSITTTIVLNLTFIYPLVSYRYNLDDVTGLDHTTLFYNYRQIIHYLNFPWRATLYMPDFPMSATGEFHFWEVKVIFHVLHGIGLLFLGGLWLAYRQKKTLLPYFNVAANLAFVLFGSMLFLILVNFEFTFYWFHRIFFNNDYWIFNANVDPVIRALPQELFMIKGIVIIILILTVSVVSKLLYCKRKTRPSGPCS